MSVPLKIQAEMSLLSPGAMVDVLQFHQRLVCRNHGDAAGERRVLAIGDDLSRGKTPPRAGRRGNVGDTGLHAAPGQRWSRARLISPVPRGRKTTNLWAFPANAQSLLAARRGLTTDLPREALTTSVFEEGRQVFRQFRRTAGCRGEACSAGDDARFLAARPPMGRPWRLRRCRVAVLRCGENEAREEAAERRAMGAPADGGRPFVTR